MLTVPVVTGAYTIDGDFPHFGSRRDGVFDAHQTRNSRSDWTVRSWFASQYVYPGRELPIESIFYLEDPKIAYIFKASEQNESTLAL